MGRFARAARGDQQGDPGRLHQPSKRTAVRVAAATLLAVLGLASGGFAAERKARFGHLTIEDGLSHNWIHAILQDHQGYLWFGTQDGLNRYDGAGFRVYRHDKDDPHSLPSNVAGALLEDSQKRLWVGSGWGGEGVSLYDRRLDRFTTYRPAPGAAVGNNVRALLEDRKGRIWLGTDNGVAELVPGTGEIKRFPLLADAKAATPEAMVMSMFEDSRGRFWVGSSQGLLRLDRERGTYTRTQGRADDANGLHRADVWAFHEDENGWLWIGTLGSGLHHLDPETGRDERFLPDPRNPKSLSNARVTRIVPDGHGKLYLGTENGGLNVLDLRSRTFERHLPDIDDSAGLNSRSIWSLALDDQGTLWIGTFNGGANFLSPFLQRFRLLEARSGLLNDSHVSSVLEDRSGTLWIGTDGGGLDRYEPATGRFSYYRSNPDDPTTIGSDAVWALLEDSRGAIWVGGWDGGLGLLDRASGRVRRYRNDPANPRTIVSNHVWRIVELRSGELLVVTQQGVELFDRASGVFTRLTDRYPGAGEDVLYSAAEDAAGNLWIVGNTFVGHVDRRSGKVTRYRHDPKDPQSLGSGWTQAVLVDSVGNVWFGTQGGLSCLAADKKRWRRYTTADGLSNDTVMGLLEDGKGALWVSTSRGLDRLVNAISVPEKPTFYNFDAHDGLQTQEFARNACAKGLRGTFYFGGARGLNSFQPDDVVPTPRAPRLALTALRMQGRLVRPGDKGSPLEVAIGETERLTLSHRDTVVAFEFAALSYVLAGKNRYRYKLEGFDQGWSEASAQRTATYTNLPRGTEFTFRVKAANNDGVWNDQGIALPVYVTPRWYERKLVWLLAAALLVASATALFRARIRGLQASERELARRVEEQTADLQKEIAGHKRTELRLAQENEERQRAEEEARQAAAKLKDGNRQLLEQQTALERENRERRRAEEEAGRERDLLRALMDNIPDLIYFKDDDGRFVRVNAALARAVGARDAEAVVGRTDRDFFSAELTAETMAEERELLRSGRAVAGKVQYDSRSRRYYLVTKVPLRAADGRRAGLVGVSKDITERKLAEDRLEQDLKAYLELVSAVASGDLSRRGEQGDETLGRIARSTNGMLDAFSAILGEVRDAALAVSSSSTEIMAAATQIAKGAQYGSDQVVSTLAAVEEMAASMSQVARHAASSSEKAHQVLEHVDRGDEATNVTNAGMARIDAAATETAGKMRVLEKRSFEIFEIIDMIEDLSAQSTLLSLNAAIEAAHAGEAGRGFAVVADEVRRLAERSKEATAKVSAIVAAMVEEMKSALEAMEHAVKEVKDGRALSTQAIESLAQIKALVKDSALLSDQITLAAREQASVTGTVVGSMQTIANVTQESAVGATSTSTAVQDLVRMSEQLMQAITRFRIERSA
jgi:PAS domain S-box-containing protein